MKRLSLCLAVVLVLAACSTGPTAEQVEGTVQARVSGTIAALPTSTPEPTATDIPTATVTPKPTSTPRPTATQRPTATPAPEFGTRLNPYPLGSIVDMIKGDELEFQVAIADVVRGERAWNTIYAANRFNDKPPEGMEYILATVVVTYTGSDKGALQLDKSDWTIVTNGQVIDRFSMPSVCCLDKEFEDLTLFAGGKANGIMAWPVSLDDQNPALVLGMKQDGSGGVYFSAAE